jgi:hypothetical protein
MAYEEKGDRGKAWIFDNQYAAADNNKPAKTGNGVISRTFLKLLMEKMKESGEDEIALDFAAWPQVSKTNGNPYLFFTFGIQDDKHKKDIVAGGGSTEDDPFKL